MNITTFFEHFNRNVKIRTKMIILICGVVLISVLPLSLIVLYRNQAVVLKDSNITGLLESYVVNVDGKYVADLNEKRIDQLVTDSDKKYFKDL